MTETNITPWIEEDFKDIDFKDKRLIRRFKDIINKFIKNAQSNISSTFNKNDFPLLNELKDELLKSASMIDVSFKKPPTITSGNHNGNGKKISAITGSSVPAIVDNHSLPSNTINYTTRNAF
jgi:hypothetical protein